MSKKKSSDTSNNNSTFSQIENIWLLIILFLYLAIDFLPKNNSLDIAGIQWLYLSILNVGVASFILYQNKKEALSNIQVLNLNPIHLLYSVFILICGISIAIAGNKTEAFATFNTMITIFLGFVLLTILAQKKKNIFHHFAILVSIILFFQVFFSVSGFYANASKLDIFSLQNFLKGNTENVNIFSTSILLKIPFVLYCIYQFKKLKQIFFLLTFILSSIVVFLTSSRSNIIALFIVIVVYSLFIFFQKSKKQRLSILYVLVLFGIAYFIQEKSIFSEKQKVVSSEITSFEISNQASGNRFFLWNNAFTLAKEKPILGYGLGNYKIKAIPLESKQNESWKISKYVHNDFLQIASETGFLNALIYLSLFVFGGFISLKKLQKSDDTELKWISFSMLLSLFILGVDSIFNFPMHRPIIAIHFIIILFWLCYLLQFNKKENLKNISISSTLILYIVIVFSVLSIVPNYITYKSFQFQNELKKDENSLLLSAIEVENNLPNFPNLTIIGQPVKAVKANYLVQEGNYDKALKYLEESKNDNKSMMYNESILAVIYSKKKENDSIYKYTKMCHEMHPLVGIFYENYMNSLVQRNDTTTIIERTNYIKNLNYYPRLLKASTIALLQLNYPKDKIKKLLSDFKNFKNDEEMTSIEEVIKDDGMDILNQKMKLIPEEDWKQKLPIYLEMNIIQPNNLNHAQNIGMSYFKINEPKKAIPYLEKALVSKELNDGKTEFVLGLCYFNLNQKEKGCDWLNKAIAKNYPIPTAIYDSRCK